MVATASRYELGTKATGGLFLNQTPKFGLFSGEDLAGKHEVDYRSRVFDVHSALHNFAEPQIQQSVYESVCGLAKRLIWCLESSATVHDYIARLNYQFGVVAGSNVLMQQFYHIMQSKGEKVGNDATHIDVALDEIRFDSQTSSMKLRRDAY